MKFKVFLSKRAYRKFKRLPPNIRRRCSTKIDSLAVNPFPKGVRKVRGVTNTYRIRIGSYRMLYRIYLEEKLIVIIRIAKRKSVYQF